MAIIFRKVRNMYILSHLLSIENKYLILSRNVFYRFILISKTFN